MSSDLWAAFGANSEDLAANPWAQPSSQSTGALKVNDPQEVGQGTNQPINLSAWEQPQSKLKLESLSQTPWDELDDLDHTTALKSTISYNDDPWTSTENKQEGTWSSTDGSGLETEPWPISREFEDPSSTVVTAPKEANGEDDFEDFEEPEQQLSQSMKGLSIEVPSDVTSSLLHETNAITPQTGGNPDRPQHRRSQSVQQYDPFTDLDLLSKPKSNAIGIKKIDSIKAPDYKPKKLNKSTALVEELVPYSADEWGEFSPEPVPSPHFVREAIKTTGIRKGMPQQASQHARSLSEPPKKVDLKTTAAESAEESTTAALPPTNVPPPSILMSLVAGLVQKLPSQVESVMQSPVVSTNSQKALEKALRRCIASLRVAARIIVGRKVRWKRDVHLSQSMKIGPAGKQGGMKLTGVDRSELKREEREAAEFVRTWQQKLGSIRSALATVNGQIAGKPLTLPDISESMAIKVLKPADGGITAAKCCALCGLKRDERVDKVDVDVWDSFGEFWTEFWGHTDCRLFWQEHERYLQRR